jgi:hypothetical protein
MTILIAFLAAWSSTSPQIVQVSVKWERDYLHAREIGTRLQKPLAVFVGSGEEGWKKVVRDGGLDANMRRLLVEQFVPVYVNVDSESGQKLAEAFELANKHGLIISDRTGELMAFRQDGDLESKDLVKHLNRLADPEHIVFTTETNDPPATIVATAPNGGFQNPFACQT